MSGLEGDMLCVSSSKNWQCAETSAPNSLTSRLAPCCAAGSRMPRRATGESNILRHGGNVAQVQAGVGSGSVSDKRERLQPSRSVLQGSIVESMYWMVLHRPVELAALIRR